MIIVLAAHYLFDVPIIGSLTLLFGAAVFFIAANLAVGFTFSTMAKSQMQAMQLSFFYFLPSLLLSGFMFPFRGMPVWAQWIGEVLPLTHFLRIIRGVMLKGQQPGKCGELLCRSSRPSHAGNDGAGAAAYRRTLALARRHVPAARSLKNASE
jgi:ABC-type polysaccharide/polyol phosphate export permease